jgi:UDP-N-acetyl-D-glucosamine dehydrogenase
MDKLEGKIKSKTAVIGIVGLGYVGLPLAVAFGEAGYKVVGFDVQEKKVDSVNKGVSYISDITSESLKALVDKKMLEATNDEKRISEVDAISICVPTPLTKTKDPDLSYVVLESNVISKHLRTGQLVILESTTYPGTTRDVVKTILEKSGLKGGKDFYLAFSPERVDPGNPSYNVKNTPKIVGGIDKPSTEMASLLYQQIVKEVIPVTSPEVAEMTKVFENIFRSVNIALVNELAQLCERMGISVWEVIAAASTKPYGFMPFYPGPGVGGHCIPLDPYYLANKARELDFHTRFIELAAEINENMPYYIVTCIMEALNERGKILKNARVLVMGVAYKTDSDDYRESPSLKLIELLKEKGARVSYNDPFLPKMKFPDGEAQSVELNEATLKTFDCAVIATGHSAYKNQALLNKAQLVFDTRGITRGMSGSNIVRLGE